MTAAALLDAPRTRAGRTLGELCELFDMTRQSASQRLDVLEQANLISTVRRVARSCTISTWYRSTTSSGAGSTSSNPTTGRPQHPQTESRAIRAPDQHRTTDLRLRDIHREHTRARVDGADGRGHHRDLLGSQQRLRLAGGFTLGASADGRLRHRRLLGHRDRQPTADAPGHKWEDTTADAPIESSLVTFAI